MKINISAPYNQVLYVSTDNYTTVYGVKVAISNILRIAIQNLHIFKGSTELKDFQVCSVCFPDMNATVSCQVIESESKFKLINTQLPEKSYISFLKNLGFPEDQINVALLYANNNIQHALELLINRANVIIEKTTHEENPSYENETIRSNFEIKQKEIEDKFNFANSNFSVIQSIESLSVPIDPSLNQQLIDAYASNHNSSNIWNDLREQFPQLSDISIKRSIFSMLDDIKHQREVNFKIPETLLKDPMLMRGQTSNTSEIIIPHPPKEVINIVELTDNYIKSHRNIKDLQQNSFQNCSQSYLAYILYIIARKLMKLQADQDWDFSEIRLLTEIMYPHLKNSFNATNIHKALSRSRSDENINNEKILIKFILISSPVFSLIPQILTGTLEIHDSSYLDNGIPTYLDELLEKLSNNEKVLAVIENMNQFPPPQPIEPNLTENINSNNEANSAETNQQATNTSQRAPSQPVPPKTTPQPAPAANPPQPSTRQRSEPIPEPQKQPETQNPPEAPPPPKRGRPGRPKIEWLKEEDQILIDVVCANNDRSAYNMASSMLPRRKPQACINRFKELAEKIRKNEVNYLQIPDNFLTCPNVITAIGRHDKSQTEPVNNTNNNTNNNTKQRELIKGEFTDQQLIDIIAQTMTNNEPDLDAAAALFESLTPYHLLSKWDEVCFDIKCNGRKDLKIPEKLQNYLKPFDGKYKYEFPKLPDEPVNVSRLLEQYIMNNYDLNKTHDSFSEYSIGYIAYIIVYMLNKYNKKYKPEPTFKDWRPIEDRILLEMMYNDEPLKDYSRYNPSKTQRHIAYRKSYISRLLSSKVSNLKNILQASKVFNMEDSQLNEDFVPKYLPNLVKAAKNNHVIDATKANDPQNFALKTIYTKQDNQLIINKVAENINDPNKFNLIAIYFPGRNARELIQHYKYLLEEYRKGNLNDLVIPDCLKNEFVPAQRSPPKPAPPPPAPSPPSPINPPEQINFNDDRLEYRIIDTYYNKQDEFKTIDKAYAMFILNYIVRRFTGQYGHWDSGQEKMLFMAQFMNKDVTPLLGDISLEKWKNRYEVLPKLLTDHKATMMMFAEKLASVKATRTENEIIPKYLVQTLNETIDQHKKKVVEQVSLTKQGLLNFVAHHRQYIDLWDLAYNHFKVMSPQEFNKSYNSLIYNIKNGIAKDLIVPNNLMPDIYPKSYKYPSNPKEMVDIRKCVKVYFKNFDFDDCVKECKGTTHGYFLFIFTYMTRYFNSNKAFDFSMQEDRVICELMGLNYPTNKINDVLDNHSAEDIDMRIKYIIESQANFDRVFKDFPSFDFNFSLEKATYNSVGIPSYLDGVVHAFSQSYFKSAHKAKKKAEQQKSKKHHIEEEQEEEEEEEEVSSDDEDSSYEVKSTDQSSSESSSAIEEEVKPKPKPVNFSIKSQEVSIKPSISVETIHATTATPHNNEEDITKYIGIESTSPVRKPRLVPIVVSSDSSEAEKHVAKETKQKANKTKTPIVVDSDSYSYYYSEEHADVETETTEDAQQPHNEEHQNTSHEENVQEDYQQTTEEASSHVENQESVHDENIQVNDHQQINEEKTQEENEEKVQDQQNNEELSSHEEKTQEEVEQQQNIKELSSHEEKIKDEVEQQQDNEELSSHEEAQNSVHEENIQQITEETTQEQQTTEDVQNEDQVNEESTQAQQATEEALNEDQQFNEESTTLDDQQYIDHEQQFADEESIANTQIDESTEHNHDENDEENQEDNSTIQESHEESHAADESHAVEDESHAMEDKIQAADEESHAAEDESHAVEEQFDENETNPENQATDQQNLTEDVSQISEEPQSYIENHFASNEETHETLTEANDYENVSVDQDQQETGADENQEETQNDHEVENQEETQNDHEDGNQEETQNDHEVENQEETQNDHEVENQEETQNDHEDGNQEETQNDHEVENQEETQNDNEVENQEETQNDHEVENQEEFQQYNENQYEEHQDNEDGNQVDALQYFEEKQGVHDENQYNEEEDKSEILFVDAGSNNREIYNPLLLDVQQTDENTGHTEEIQNEVQTNDDENKQETLNEEANDQGTFNEETNDQGTFNEETNDQETFNEETNDQETFNEETNDQGTFNEETNDQEIFGDISNADNEQKEEDENRFELNEQYDIPIDNSSTPLFTFQNPEEQDETQKQFEEAHNDDATNEQEQNVEEIQQNDAATNDQEQAQTDDAINYQEQIHNDDATNVQKQTQNDDATNVQKQTQDGEEIQQNDESVEQQNPNENAENNEVQVIYEAPFENEEFIDTHNDDIQNQQNEESNDQNKQNENEEEKNSFEIDSLSSVQREDFGLSEDRVESQDEDNFRAEQRQTTEESEHSQHEGASVDEILRRIQMNFQSNDFNSDQIEHPEPLKEDEIIQNLEHKAVEDQNEEILQNNLQNQEQNNGQQQNSFVGQENFQNLSNQENQIENSQNQETNPNPQNNQN